MQIRYFILPELWIILIFQNNLKVALLRLLKNQKTKFLVMSFSSDWLYTTKENKDIVIALNSSGADVSYSEIITDKGHDSFY